MTLGQLFLALVLAGVAIVLVWTSPTLAQVLASLAIVVVAWWCIIDTFSGVNA